MEEKVRNCSHKTYNIKTLSLLIRIVIIQCFITVVSTVVEFQCLLLPFKAFLAITNTFQTKYEIKNLVQSEDYFMKLISRNFRGLCRKLNSCKIKFGAAFVNGFLHM